MPKQTWTDPELADLKRLYGTKPVGELTAEHFLTKSKSSIKWQVKRWGLGKETAMKSGTLVFTSSP